jgi:hypothetical protein
MSTVSVTNLKNAASASNNIVLGADGSVSIVGGAVSPYTGMRNRIINGGMTIDQRNAGASITPSDGAYTLDRWTFDLSQTSKITTQQNAGSVTPPTGFTNYLGITSSSAYTVLAGDYFAVKQLIEGFNCFDLAWGTANASAVTLSFWVRSSLTGTFGGCFSNSANNRAYPFTYTISTVNTWEQKTITVAGDTSGTWLTTNGVGIEINFGLGVGTTFSGAAGAWAASNLLSATGATSVVGTSGATFYITGVQLEKGSVATPFEFRSIGTELGLCQRYYVKQGFDVAGVSSTVDARYYFPLSFPVTMRATPTTAWVSGGDVSTGLPQGAITAQAGSVAGSPSSILIAIIGPTVTATGTAAVMYNDPIFQITAEL